MFDKTVGFLKEKYPTANRQSQMRLVYRGRPMIFPSLPEFTIVVQYSGIAGATLENLGLLRKIVITLTFLKLF